MRRIIHFCFAFLLSVPGYLSPQEVKAKIAIMHKHGDDLVQLRSQDRVHVGEMIRIFIQPETNAYIYVVHSDDSISTILFDEKIKALKDTLILPSDSEFYIFDNESPAAKISIFCSREKISSIENLFDKNNNLSLSVWNEVEKKLLGKHTRKLTDKSEKPFSIAGNVSAVNDEFLEQQRYLTAEDVIIRIYEIEIKE